MCEWMPKAVCGADLIRLSEGIVTVWAWVNLVECLCVLRAERRLRHGPVAVSRAMAGPQLKNKLRSLEPGSRRPILCRSKSSLAVGRSQFRLALMRLIECLVGD